MTTKNKLFVIKALAPITQYQDLGRFAYLHQGFSVSGPMDDEAFAINNRILGNDANATQLEIAPGGLCLRCLQDCTISIAGAYAMPTLNGEPLINFCATQIKKGDELRFGFAKVGQFCYLAVAGGFSPTPFLGSTSTTKRLHIFPDEELTVGSYLVGKGLVLEKLQGEKRELLPRYTESIIAVIPTFQYDEFSDKAKYHFTSQSFRVDKSDRMGTRLTRLINGEPVNWEGKELLSEGLLAGAIQITPEGNPIVLQKDAQSIGGYPKIGLLPPQSRSLLAQKKEGTVVQFRWCTSP